MKTYMNRDDREHHEFIMIAWDYLKKWAGTTKCLTTKERGRIRAACTHLLHVSDALISRMEVDYAKKILRDAERVAVHMVDRTITEETVPVKVDDIYDLADYALIDCCDCNIEKHKECPLFKVLFRLNVPVVKVKAKGCPYEQRREAGEVWAE